MYDVNWYVGEDENGERFENEDDARERYEELIATREYEWVELVYVIDNWCAERD